MQKFFLLAGTLVSLVVAPGGAVAQEAAEANPMPEAAAADVESIDAIIAALYDVISGPAGERDWERFRSLFAPQARLASMVPRNGQQPTAQTFSAEDYVQRAGAFFMQNGFFEREIGRSVRRFGNVANAMSAYDSRRAVADPEPFAVGINSITLLNANDRWYVMSIAWDEVREGNPLPDWVENSH